MPSDTGTTDRSGGRLRRPRPRLPGGGGRQPGARGGLEVRLPARAQGRRAGGLAAGDRAGRTRPEWAGVGALLQEEGREEAERLLSGLAAQVNEITGGLPILLIREGDPRDELLALIAEDPRISILILAAAAGGGNPGPLIAALIGRYGGRVTVPMTIVPGSMDDDALERVT
jgi:hypothetical protein